MTSRPEGNVSQGVILGMFFYGYVLTQLPGGRLAELFGGKWLFGVGQSRYRDTNIVGNFNSVSGVLITAVFTLLTPVAAQAGLPFLYAVRIIEVS